MHNCEIIEINPNIYSNLAIQLEKDGSKSIFKSLKSAQKTLTEHELKVEIYKKAGGYTSQVEGTVRRVKSQIKTIEQFIIDNKLK